MNRRILDRYLFREVLTAWAAVTFILLAIMIATRFASVLGVAAKGELPRELLLNVALLSSLRYLVILIPVSLLLAIMLSLGRLYSDNEIAAMTACGSGLGRLYRPFLGLAAGLTALTAALSFSIGPWAGRQADFLVKDAKRLVQFTPFEAGQFKTVAGGRAVFYTDAISPDGRDLGKVFAELEEADGASVVVADHGTQQIDATTGERVVELSTGHRYFGTPGTASYDVVRFDALTLRLSPPPFSYINNQRKLKATGALWGSADAEDQAELHFRIAAPVSVLILALLAVPLAHLKPRQGRYSKIVFGILVYLIYSNLLGVGQAWIGKGQVSPLIGLWWAHGLVLGAALWMIRQRQQVVA